MEQIELDPINDKIFYLHKIDQYQQMGFIPSHYDANSLVQLKLTYQSALEWQKENIINIFLNIFE